MSGFGLLVSDTVLFCVSVAYSFLGAEEAAVDGGMISHPLDIGYMGVHSVWTNNLGEPVRPSQTGIY